MYFLYKIHLTVLIFWNSDCTLVFILVNICGAFSFQVEMLSVPFNSLHNLWLCPCICSLPKFTLSLVSFKTEGGINFCCCMSSTILQVYPTSKNLPNSYEADICWLVTCLYNILQRLSTCLQVTSEFANHLQIFFSYEH